MKLFCVYVLENKKGWRYIGSTKNLSNRLNEHRRGNVFSTRNRRPLSLIYVEGCILESDARRRERYLKTTRGKRFLAKRIIDYNKAKKPL